MAGLWIVTLVAIACSALSERLRSKADLERLSMMIAAFDQSSRPSDIADPARGAHEAYGFPRAALIGSPNGDPALLGPRCRRTAGSGARPRSLARAWTDREVVSFAGWIGRAISGSPACSDARNVLVVPLLLGRLGSDCFSNTQNDAIATWTVAGVQRFAFHAALALRSAWWAGDGRRIGLARASAAVR